VSQPRWSVPLSDLEVEEAHVQAAVKALRSGWWSMGPRVERFEAAFADLIGTAHAVAVAIRSAKAASKRSTRGPMLHQPDRRA